MTGVRAVDPSDDAASDAWPHAVLVSTGNADDDAPLIAVDEALGAVGTSTTYRCVP